VSGSRDREAGELELGLAVGDLGQDAVEILAGEGPLERSEDLRSEDLQ
jgi:hypothetical protein